MSRVYYNEIDPHAAEWLANSMQAGLIPYGFIDTRSIRLVQPADLDGFTHCHFFAGIGGWAYAARLAGWPDDRELWTGSCPCQPFSAAGKREGAADERHLWPDFLRLIRARRPACVMGEQVAGALGYGWFDGVRADLAGEDFASRTVDIPALAVNAPHERNRLYWVARNDGSCGPLDDAVGSRLVESGAALRPGRDAADDANGRGRGGDMADPDGGLGDWRSVQQERGSPGRTASRGADAGEDGGLAVANAPGQGRRELLGPGESGSPDGERPSNQPARPDGRLVRECQEPVAVADPEHGRRQGRDEEAERGRQQGSNPVDGSDGRDRSPRGMDFWRRSEWLVCHDGKARRAEPGAPLLVDGVRGRVLVRRPEGFPEGAFEGEAERWVSRVGAWKGAGNAIVPQEAAEVIAAYRDVFPDNYETFAEPI